LFENFGKLYPDHVFNNRYRIISVIGVGGMSRVYLAEDLRLKGKEWAIKEILIQQKEHQQFVDEAKILISLKHPNLPNIIDYYPPDQDNISYLVMDFIKGDTLLNIFTEKKYQLNEQRIIVYLLQMCDLFDYLHNKLPNPIIHRDLKPANIMIDEQDKVRLIDFGIARSYKEGKIQDTTQMGTIGFASPEQFAKKQTDHRSDIYSLGALSYFLFSKGQYYHITQKPINILRNDLPHDLVWLIKKMLRANPDDRYQNIKEVKKELEKILLELDLTAELALTERLHFDQQIKPAKGKTMEENNEAVLQSANSAYKSKTIAFLSLYPRSGSSFIAGNLAGYLAQKNVPAMLVDPPSKPGYWFEYFSDDFAKQKSWFNWEQFNLENGDRKNSSVCLNKEGIQIVTHKKPAADWNEEKMIRFMLAVKQAPIVIYDFSNYVESDLSTSLVLDYADLFWVVVDFDLVHLQMYSDKLIQLQKKYPEKVMVILNKDRGTDYGREIKKELKGCNYFPFVEQAQTAEWESKLAVEFSEGLVEMNDFLYELSTSFVAKELLEDRRKKSFIKKIFSR